MGKIWKAKWIMDRQFYGKTPINVFHKQHSPLPMPEHSPGLKNRHMLVRKVFMVEEEIQRAYIDITADDYYKLYINGSYVAQGPAPGYYFHYYYNRHDITEYLKKGKNVIAVHTYYQGLINRVWNSGDYRQGMIAEVLVNDELSVATDSTWKYSISGAHVDGGIIGYETQYLENLDSRLLETGWKEPDFDDSHWNQAYVNLSDDHKLVLQPTPALQVYEEKPAVVKIIEKGHYFLDFGQEITGLLQMKAKGSPGQVVEIRYGEELCEGKTDEVRYNMRCNCIYREYWTLSGREDVLELFDYKAFRYAEILDPDQAVCPDSFSAMVQHYPLEEERCTFDSSNELLNQIWRICKNGIKYGTQEGFVDCPTREKGQYLGDMTVTGHSHLYLSGDLRLYKKMLRDFALSSFICPGIMTIAPGSFMQEIADYSLQFPMQFLTYYRQSGDLEFLKEMYPVVEGIIEYFSRFKREDGLLENVTEKWNLVDWPKNLRDDYDFDLGQPAVGEGCHNVVNAFYCGCVQAVNEIRDILKVEYQDEMPRLREAFVKAFYNPEKKLFVDSEVSTHSSLHANVLPFFFNLAPDEAKGAMAELIEGKGFSCGVYMAYFLLKGLARAGRHDLVYRMLISENDHSWANMLREGATTCFEAWGKEQKWNTSLCHPWASAPIVVLIEDIMGITPGLPGWEEVRFSPHIPAQLERISATIPTPKGSIRLEYRDGAVQLEAPEGVRVIRE